MEGEDTAVLFLGGSSCQHCQVSNIHPSIMGWYVSQVLSDKEFGLTHFDFMLSFTQGRPYFSKHDKQ